MERSPDWRFTAARHLWRRFSEWLGRDQSQEPDLLLTDPARHFREWDRDLPDRYC